MAIKVQTEFIRKATLRTIVYVYDDDEALVNATTVDITIIDPDGTVVVNEVDMTPPTSKGTYEHYYTTTTSIVEGDYQIECDITDGSYHTYVHAHVSFTAGIKE